MRMSSRLSRLGTSSPRTCSERAGDFRQQPLVAREADGQRPAHVAQPEAEGGRRVAPCHPVARLLLLGAQAAAGNRLQPVAAHPLWGRRREGAVGRVRDIMPWHGAKLYPRRGVCRAPKRSWGGGGEGGASFRHDRVHDRGRALPEHVSKVAVPLGLVVGYRWRGP